MELSFDEMERYKRNICVKEIGIEGQMALKKAKILVAGCGGLGSPAALYLAAAGLGHIGLVDADKVDLSNLQRQILHAESSLGMSKAKSAEKRLLSLNHEIEVKVYDTFLNLDNFKEIAGDYDFILDCTDSYASKFIISDGSCLINKPFCHGAVVRFQGQVMTCIPGISPCYRCIFDELEGSDDLPSPSKLGVVGASCGIIGSIQALEAIKYITHTGDLLTNSLLTFDGLTMSFKKLKLPKRNPMCKACNHL